MAATALEGGPQPTQAVQPHEPSPIPTTASAPQPLEEEQPLHACPSFPEPPTAAPTPSSAGDPGRPHAAARAAPPAPAPAAQRAAGAEEACGCDGPCAAHATPLDVSGPAWNPRAPPQGHLSIAFLQGEWSSLPLIHTRAAPPADPPPAAAPASPPQWRRRRHAQLRHHADDHHHHHHHEQSLQQGEMREDGGPAARGGAVGGDGGSALRAFAFAEGPQGETGGAAPLPPPRRDVPFGQRAVQQPPGGGGWALAEDVIGGRRHDGRGWGDAGDGGLGDPEPGARRQGGNKEAAAEEEGRVGAHGGEEEWLTHEVLVQSAWALAVLGHWNAGLFKATLRCEGDAARSCRVRADAAT